MRTYFHTFTVHQPTEKILYEEFRQAYLVSERQRARLALRGGVFCDMASADMGLMRELMDGVSDLKSININIQDLKCITALTYKYYEKLGLGRFLNQTISIDNDVTYRSPSFVSACESRAL